jgi:hypothetical protein
LLAALLVLGAGSPALADEEGGGLGSRISGVVQFDFTNAYFFRGILNERDDFIFQPWAELYLNLYSSETGPIRDVTIGFGVWASIHDNKTLADKSPKLLYETDWYPLISVGLPCDLTYTTTYYFYTSPNGAWPTVQEWNHKLAWDDSEVLGRFAISPYINVAIETSRSSTPTEKGVGIQLGLEPTLYEFENESFPLALTLPMEIGLSAGDYYESQNGNDDTFGYASWALKGSLPLTFIHESYGAWKLGLTGKLYYFGDNLAALNRGNDVYGQVVASLGVEF